MNTFVFLILGLALPILLWPIEYFLPFPHLIEELAKFLSLVWLSSKFIPSEGIYPLAGQAKNKLSFKTVLLFALLFTLSESMLYMMNLFALGQIYLLPKRLLLTGLLHVSTVSIMFFGVSKSNIWKVVSLVVAVGLHYIYNNWLVLLLQI